MARKEEHAYFVKHPVLGNALVAATNKEQASLKAAEWWGVPWAWIAGDIDIERAKMELRKNVCSRCGTYINSGDMRCDDCERKMREAYEASKKKISWGQRQVDRAERMRRKAAKT